MSAISSISCLVPVVLGIELELEARVAVEALADRPRSWTSPPSKLPSRVEQTKRSGCGSRSTTSHSASPFWRSARSSAADSYAQRR